MRITEFAINIIHKWGFVSKDSLATLNVQLSEGYMDKLNSQKLKVEKNEMLKEKLNAVEIKLDETDEHSPEYKQHLFEFEKIKRQIDEPTIVEKIIAYLDKPMVRLALVILFAVVSRYIAKKVMGIDKDDEDRESEHESQNQNQNQNQYQQGFNNGYPPPMPPNYNWYQQPPINRR